LDLSPAGNLWTFSLFPGIGNWERRILLMGAACQVLPIRNIDKEYRAMVHKAVDEILDKLEGAFEERTHRRILPLCGIQPDD
jgi:hypothetical protein